MEENQLQFQKLIELPESEWFIVENTHPAIVTQELFDRVQIEVNKNKKYAAKGELKRLFQGMIYCKECGHSIGISFRKVKNGTSAFTVCNFYAKYSKYDMCSPHRLNYNLLEEDLLCFLRKIGEVFLRDYNEENMIQESIKIQKTEIIKLEKQIEMNLKEIEKNQNILTSLYEDRLNEVIAVRQYTMMAKKYDDKILNLEKENESLGNELKKMNSGKKNKSHEECKVLLENYMKFEYPSNELIHQIVDRIEIDKDKNVEVFFKVDIAKYVEISAKKGQEIN